MTFWERVRLGIQRAFLKRTSQGPVEETPPPERGYGDVRDREQEAEDVQYNPPPERPQPLAPLQQQQPEEGECITGYAPGYKEGRRNVFPRWYAQYPDIDCIRDLFNSAGYHAAYSIVVCGIPTTEYPTKVGQEVICLTYRIDGDTVLNILEDPNVLTGTDFASELDSVETLTYGWETVEEISILDKE